jgi:putative FmdB family regulatory protein
MPTYGYRCDNGHEFEVVQGMTEKSLTTCVECGAPVRRIFYPVGVVFKGQGFYKTDSRGGASAGIETPKPDAKPEKVDNKADRKAADKTDTKPSKPAESKPASPTPSATEKGSKQDS